MNGTAWIGGDAWPYLTQITADIKSIPLACSNAALNAGDPDRLIDYPIARALFSIFDGITAWHHFLTVHLLVALLGTYLLLSRFTKDRNLTILMTFTYVVSNLALALVYWGHPGFLVGMSLLPLALWALLASFEGAFANLKNAAYAGFSGALMGLTALAGGWYAVAFSAPIYAFALFELWVNRKEEIGGIRASFRPAFLAFSAGTGFLFITGLKIIAILNAAPYLERVRTGYLPLNFDSIFGVLLFGQSSLASPLTNAHPIYIPFVVFVFAMVGAGINKARWPFVAALTFALLSMVNVTEWDTARAIAMVPLMLTIAATQAIEAIPHKKIIAVTLIVFFVLHGVTMLAFQMGPLSYEDHSYVAWQLKEYKPDAVVEIEPHLVTTTRELQYFLVRAGVNVQNPYASIRERNHPNCSNYVLTEV